MTQNQIKLLKLLGYTKSNEEGAVLEHKSFSGMEAYVWKGTKFEDVLKNHTALVEHAAYHRIAGQIKVMANS